LREASSFYKIMEDPDLAPPKQPVLMYELPYPRTKRLSFHVIIHSDHLPTKEILAQTSSYRDEVYQALEDGSPANIISTCENYFPFLFGLVASIQYNQNLRLNTPMTFSWSSPFVEKVKPFVSYTYNHEVIMIAMAYGIAHYNRGMEIYRNINSSSFDEESKKVVLYMKAAAGIFQYIHVVELTRWVEIPAERPPELHLNVVRALQDYATATAQSVTMKKGLTTGLSKGLLAKLAMQNWQQYERFVVACRATKNYKELIPTTLRKFLPWLLALSKATAMKYMAQNAYEQQKYGAAASYMIVAQEALRKIRKKPISSSISKKYGQEIQDCLLNIDHIHRRINGENEHVYYQKIINEEQLEMIESKSAVQISMWLPPNPSYDRII